jgi:hypothetical protein
LNTIPSSGTIASPLRASVDEAKRVVNVNATTANILTLMYFKVSSPPAWYQAVPASHFTNAQKELKTYHFILVAPLPTHASDQEVEV